MRTFFILNFAFFISFCRADEIADISVSPHAIYTGNTFHGYAEMQVTLENDSPKPRTITLVYPNNGYGNSGNCIGRLSRSVTLARACAALSYIFSKPNTGIRALSPNSVMRVIPSSFTVNTAMPSAW